MGYGDELMATGIAKIQKKKNPNSQIVIGNYNKKTITQSVIFNNNPNIITDSKKIDPNLKLLFINNSPDNRPYFDMEKTILKKRMVWNFQFKPTPGELFFSEQEIEKAKKTINNAEIFWNSINNKKHSGIIFIETTSVKISNSNFSFKHINKDWGRAKWLELIDRLKKKYLVIQSLHSNSTHYDGIFEFESNFREAAATMRIANLFLGPEGGFGHVAAAINKPAVIIFGGWVHPQTTGYDFHENIYVDIKGSPCGIYSHECDHCKECMNIISVEKVEKSVIRNFNKKMTL
jgi:hypothetical protein